MTTITSNILLPNYNPEEVGLKGEKGDNGQSSFIHIAYSNSSDGGVDFSTTDASNRSFMGSYSDFDMIDSSDPSKYEWQRVKGDSGKDGIAGKDGVGLSSTVITYAASTSASVAPSSGWTAQVPNVAEGSYLWTKTVWNYTDSTSETGYSVARMGADGDRGQDGIAGKDGVGIKTTVIEYAVNTSGTVRPTTGWTTTIPTTSPGQYLWTRTTWTYTDNTTEQGYSVARQGNNGATGPMGPTGQDGIAGKDGVGLSSTVITYAASASGTTAPSSGWTTQVPTVAPNNFLWTKTVWSYTDSTSETGYSVARMGANGANGSDGIAGKDGVGIKSTSVDYVVSTQGTTAPTSGWSTTIPVTPEGQYLWTRTKWTYTDNTTETGYSVAKQGAKGATGATGATGKDGIAGKDGVGLKTTVINYAASTSGTTAPSTGWQVQVPTVAPNNFLWTRTTWTYTDNTAETGYSVAKMGADGAKGNDGIAGKDGVGIRSTLVEYVVSVTGTNAPASGWSTTIPITPEGQYLWTRTKWTYTDNTTETGYSVAKQGAKGATGATGATGPNGVGIASTIIEYNKSTSSTIKPTTGWTSAIPSISGGEYLWTRTTLNYTNSTKAESYTVSRQGQDGSDGQLFTGEFAPTNFNEGDLWYKVVSGKVTAVFKATSGQWIEVPFDSSVIAETIVGKTIQASHLTGSTIDGGTISGAEFLNEYTNVTSGVNQVTDGIFKIESGILQAGSSYYLTDSAGTKLYKFATTEADIHQGAVNLIQKLYNDTGVQTSQSSASISGGLITLSLSDASGNYMGVLNAKALTNTPWVNLQMGVDWTARSYNGVAQTPQYRIIYNLDGSRTIKFRGEIQLKTGTMSVGKAYTPFNNDGHTLPADVRPQSNVSSYAPVGVASGTTFGGQWALLPSGYWSLGVAQNNTSYANLATIYYDIV